MVIISKSILVQFGLKHSNAIEALNKWYLESKNANWKNLKDIKDTFNSVDYIGNDRYVFNIKGNKYRLIAMIHLDIRTIYIRFIGTHKEYDKVDCLKI